MLGNDRLKGLLRVIYYKFYLKVAWQPSYNPLTGVYGAKIGKIKIYFMDPPFYDIEYGLLNYISNLSPNGSRCFIDAGSFIGTEAVYFAKLSPQNFVVAIEPDPGNYLKLLSNISLNKLTNVLPINAGLWNTTHGIKFVPNNGEMSGVVFKNNKNSIHIKTATLDSLCQKLNRKIDYVKMDIEGAEIEALQGAIKCIQKDHPKFIIATYHVRNGSMTKIRVEKILKKYYPKVKSINSKQLITIAKFF